MTFGGVKKAKSMPNSVQINKKNAQTSSSKTLHQIAIDAASAASRISFIEKGHQSDSLARKNGPGIIPNIVFRCNPRLIEEILEEDTEEGHSGDEKGHRSKESKVGEKEKNDPEEIREFSDNDDDDDCNNDNPEVTTNPPQLTKEEKRKAAIARKRQPQNIKMPVESKEPQFASAPLFRVLASFLVKIRIMESKRQKMKSET